MDGALGWFTGFLETAAGGVRDVLLEREQRRAAEDAARMQAEAAAEAAAVRNAATAAKATDTATTTKYLLLGGLGLAVVAVAIVAIREN